MQRLDLRLANKVNVNTLLEHERAMMDDRAATKGVEQELIAVELGPHLNAAADDEYNVLRAISFPKHRTLLLVVDLLHRKNRILDFLFRRVLKVRQPLHHFSC